MTIGEVNLALLVPLGKPETEEAIDAILGGMVIAAWTAFETMASDLWVAALNAHPVKLAALSGTWHKPEKFEADELTEDEEDQKQDKTVKLQDLQMNGYDLSKKMGSVHKYRFKWGVLEGIRRAYGAAFSNHYDEIKSAIEDHSIDALAAARNVLVHKAGVVDGKFKKKHRNWPAFAGLEPETVLQLDGVAVRDLLGASLGSAIKLMNAVDIWLVSY